MWFLFSVITVLAWGGADVFYKLGSKPGDRLSHWHIVIMVGLVMGLHAALYILTTGVSYDPVNIVRYLPVSSMYILSMTLGYAGLRYIELSVSSPVCNSSGAVAALLCFFFLGQTMTGVQFFAVAVISAGIFGLALIERRSSPPVREEDKRYSAGVIAILFPVLYCVVDGLGTFADAFFLDQVMSEAEANLSYEFTFLIVAAFALIYVVFVKKDSFTLKGEGTRLAAAILETAGQFFYVYAMADNSIVVAPLISSYSIVSVILSRVFLKEKLTRAQYAVIVFIMAAIFTLGFE